MAKSSKLSKSLPNLKITRLRANNFHKISGLMNWWGESPSLKKISKEWYQYRYLIIFSLKE